MPLTTETFGRMPDGRPVERHTLTAGDQGLRVQLIDYGALVTSVLAPDRQGRREEVTLGFDRLEDYLQHSAPYFGATIGRFANRIDHARFTLDGATYHLPANEPPHTLHGGRQGFDKVLWQARTEDAAQGPAVHFSYLSPDGEEGFPGTLSVRVSFSLPAPDTLRIEYSAQSDAPTPLNLTNHTYWNLAGDGRGTILGHTARFQAPRYLAKRADLIPTGEIADVSGTPLDFRQPRPIGERIGELEAGYDHCLVVADRSGAMQPVAEVTDPVSGRVLEMATTEPGFQFYTGNYLEGTPGRGGRTYRRHEGFCLEAQHFPDAPNQPAFPSTILRPGQTYRQVTEYRFGVTR